MPNWARLCEIAPTDEQRKALVLDIGDAMRDQIHDIDVWADRTLEGLGVDLNADDELGAYPPTDAERAWLTKRGAACPLIGCCGSRLDAGLWVPDSEAPRSFVFPLLDGRHRCVPGHAAPTDTLGGAVSLVDLAAWRPSAPSEIHLRRGLVYALGEYNIEIPDEEPLRLWSTPLAWAAADFRGAVVLDWRAAAGSLLMWRHIACDSLALAERLNEALAAERKRQTPRKPEVGVIE